MQMSKNAIELRHVSRSFGDFGISDLNLTLPSGCILGLMGENGAGKSTTIRLLMNTLRRDSGEIFVLDMGDPVKIDDLARNLIKLSGHVPDVDIKIEYTGLRPGEKLYEEKLMMEEGLRRTPNKKIQIGKPLEIDEEQFWKALEQLKEVCQHNNEDYLDLMLRLVPTYHPENSAACVVELHREDKKEL